MVVNFITPTILSPLDILSMGDSSKREDCTKIGQFDSGLKYAIAILMRHNIDITIDIYSTYTLEKQHSFKFDTYEEKCAYTPKSKKLIKFKDVIAINEYPTGFALNLGFNWEPWQAIRELISNTVDEGGTIAYGNNYLNVYGTVITLDIPEGNIFIDIINDINSYYINNTSNYIKVNDTCSIFPSKNGYLEIFKQNILVYKDINIKSYYSFNILFGELDEQRILRNSYECVSNVFNSICFSDNEKLFQEIIKPKPFLEEDDILNNRNLYCCISDACRNRLQELVNKKEEIFTFSGLMKKAKAQFDFLPERTIFSVSESMYSYPISTTYKANVFSSTPFEEKDVEDQIYDLYDFPKKIKVIPGEILDVSCIADINNNQIIVKPDFDTDKDMDRFIVEYFSLYKEGNVLLSLGEFIKQKIKK